MRRTMKFATLFAVALAFTACSDSVQQQITAPDGLRMTHLSGSVSPALDAVYHDAEELLNVVYACANTKQQDNKNKDLEKVAKYAAAGWWTATDNPNDLTGSLNVAYMVDQIIANTDGLIAKKTGGIPAACPNAYANGDLAALTTELYFLLNVFKNQGEYTQGDVSATFCPSGTECEETGNGWKFNIPAGTFGTGVVIVVKPNNGQAPQNFTPAPNSASFHFDVFPADAQAANGWTRYICWEGTNDANEPDEDWIVMVREAGNGVLDYLPTVWEPWAGATCTSSTTSLNIFLKGAHKLLAGLPFFPKDLQAYSPPRTFGGSSTASSPHWLTIVEPVPGYTLAQLRSLTDQYYGTNSQNKNAALTKLDAAAACASDDVECWNSALAEYMGVVKAQTQPPGNKVLTAAQGAELQGIALALMK